MFISLAPSMLSLSGETSSPFVLVYGRRASWWWTTWRSVDSQSREFTRQTLFFRIVLHTYNLIHVSNFISVIFVPVLGTTRRASVEMRRGVMLAWKSSDLNSENGFVVAARFGIVFQTKDVFDARSRRLREKDFKRALSRTPVFCSRANVYRVLCLLVRRLSPPLPVLFFALQTRLKTKREIRRVVDKESARVNVSYLA